MNKSVLVIDTPERCVECPLLYRSEDIPLGNCTYQMTWDCGMKSTDVEDGYITNPMYNKPTWCPLTPLPDKQQISSIDTEYQRAAKTGWNSCLNQIQKGTAQ